RHGEIGAACGLACRGVGCVEVRAVPRPGRSVPATSAPVPPPFLSYRERYDVTRGLGRPPVSRFMEDHPYRTILTIRLASPPGRIFRWSSRRRQSWGVGETPAAGRDPSRLNQSASRVSKRLRAVRY